MLLHEQCECTRRLCEVFQHECAYTQRLYDMHRCMTLSHVIHVTVRCAGVRLSVFSQAKNALEASNVAHTDAVRQWQHERSDGSGSCKKHRKGWWQRLRRQRNERQAQPEGAPRCKESEGHDRGGASQMVAAPPAADLWQSGTALQRYV